jgi:hypothetical protein
MKRPIFSATLCLLAVVASVDAAIVVPGANGTDGALNITQDTVIDLSRAVTGSWDQDNTANAGNGVYDANKWAVVFKYTSVNVLAGKKLTFKNHATRAPVVWLVSGNVTISGTVDLSGGKTWDNWSQLFHPITGSLNGQLLEPGPGGFRGGAGWRGGNVLNGAGFGPGGGFNDRDYVGGLVGAAAGYGVRGGDHGNIGSGGNAYGNPSLVPLIGGSGGAGAWWDGYGFLGGSGGGAILIASNGKLTCNSGGSLIALGGNGWGGRSGAGSGGGVRVVCNELTGDGNISAAGGTGAPVGPFAPVGSFGRIRIERVVNEANFTVTPAPSTVDLADGSTAMLWPPAGAPEARVIAVNEVAAPADPKAAFGAYTPDVALPLVSSVNVIVETLHVEKASKVVVRVTPRNGMTVLGENRTTATEVNATIKEVVSESPLKLRWQATLPTLPGHSAIQARVVRP